jgi:hypothetical protein
MKTKLLAILLTVNLIWSVWLLFPTHRDPGPEAESQPQPAPLESAAPSPVINLEPQPFRSSPSAASPAGRFHWSQLESTDYGEYTRNLRAIGCPEQTIADIITADVHAVFDGRRAQVTSAEPIKFWQPGGGTEMARSEIVKLDQEERTVLDSLLGTRAALPETGELSGGLSGQRLLPQPQAEQTALVSLQADFSAQFDQLFAGAQERDLSKSEMSRLADLIRAQTDALKTILTPEEREEFEVRNSPIADELRSALQGLEVTEAEFRVLVHLRQEQLKQMEALVGSDAGIIEAAKLASADAARQLLGAGRFAQFQRTQSDEPQQFAGAGVAQGTQAGFTEASSDGLEPQPADPETEGLETP